MEFIRQGSTLPVPLNVVPSVKSVSRLLAYPVSWCRRGVGSSRDGATISGRHAEHSFSTLSDTTTTTTVGTIFTCMTSEVNSRLSGKIYVTVVDTVSDLIGMKKIFSNLNTYVHPPPCLVWRSLHEIDTFAACNRIGNALQMKDFMIHTFTIITEIAFCR